MISYLSDTSRFLKWKKHLQDKETGVKYLYVRKYKDGGITRYIEKEER